MSTEVTSEQRSKLQHDLSAFFATQHDIVFAFLFGSFADPSRLFPRDVDVAVFADPEPDLMRLGLLQYELEGVTGRKTDLVLLNGLPAQNPLLATQIFAHGIELYVRPDTEARETLIRTRVQTIHFFEDTEPLRRLNRAAMDQRIATGNFGRPIRKPGTAPSKPILQV